jgi:hypothetical protein
MRRSRKGSVTETWKRVFSLIKYQWFRFLSHILFARQTLKHKSDKTDKISIAQYSGPIATNYLELPKDRDLRGFYSSLTKRAKSESQDKSVFIVGSGPSIAYIDYSRLPKNCDVWRANTFFFESKYYAGRNVDAYFTYGCLTERMIPNLHILYDNKEYNVNFARVWTDRYEQKDPQHIRTLARSFNEYLAYEDPEYYSNFLYNWVYSPYCPPREPFTGVSAIVVAQNFGYKKIFLAGHDMHLASKGIPSYLWGDPLLTKPYYSAIYKALKLKHWGEKPREPISENVKPATLDKATVVNIENYDFLTAALPSTILNHPTEYQLQYIKMAQTRGVDICSVSQIGPMNNFVPLAPILEERDSWGKNYQPEPRPQNATIDFPQFPLMDIELINLVNERFAHN